MSRQAYAEVWTFADPITEFLKPAKNTEVHVYLAGTSNLATIYEQREGGSPGANPFISQENGLILFWANTGDYDIKFHDTTIPARFGDYIVGWQSSPVNVEIEGKELSNLGEYIEWVQESSGAWLAKIKSGSIGKDRLKSALELPLSMLEPNVQQSLFSSGDIKPTARSSAPTGWLLCNGASKLQSEFASLFAAIGTAFGSVDGTHFTLPDLQGRTPIGAGSGSGLTVRTIGSKVGEETHQMSEAEMPSHRHNVGYFAEANHVAGGPEAQYIFNDGSSLFVTKPTGGNQPHNNMQPFQVINFLIKT